MRETVARLVHGQRDQVPLKVVSLKIRNNNSGLLRDLIPELMPEL